MIAQSVRLRASAVLSFVFSVILVSPTLRAQEAPPAAAVKVPVAFLTVEEAKKAIVDDASDAYFSRLVPHEMSAKTGAPITGDTIEAQRAECKARYQAACEEFTAEERQAITTLLERIHPAVEKAYPGFAKQPWSFLKLSPRLEGGMPHTRGPHIVVSSRVLGAIRQMAAGGDAGATAAAGLLVHEQTHVVERLYPDKFVKLFTDVMGFRKAKSIEPDAWVTARQLVNPDGADVTWVFPLKDGEAADAKPRWVWPLLVFDDPEAMSLRGMTVVAIDLDVTKGSADAPESFKLKQDANGGPSRVPLQDVDAYVKAVRTNHNLYHPNEAAADLMARLAAIDALGGTDDPAPEALEPVRKWAREAFGKTAKE